MTAVQQSAGGQLKISKSQPRTGYPTTVTDHLLGKGCVLSSIEGQVAMEYFDFSEAGHLKNCEPEFLISTPERLQELLSCGAIETSDVSFLYPKFPSRIAALPFRRDGRLLAVASSYTYEEGKKGVDSWL
uniref:Mitotic checkpoint protein bub3 n=1 Tax=Solanum tuberosum TaxID=4113 RepID=M1CLW0_SOLTU